MRAGTLCARLHDPTLGRLTPQRSIGRTILKILHSSVCGVAFVSRAPPCARRRSSEEGAGRGKRGRGEPRRRFPPASLPPRAINTRPRNAQLKLKPGSTVRDRRLSLRRRKRVCDPGVLWCASVCVLAAAGCARPLLHNRGSVRPPKRPRAGRLDPELLGRSLCCQVRPNGRALGQRERGRLGGATLCGMWPPAATPRVALAPPDRNAAAARALHDCLKPQYAGWPADCGRARPGVSERARVLAGRARARQKHAPPPAMGALWPGSAHAQQSTLLAQCSSVSLRAPCPWPARPQTLGFDPTSLSRSRPLSLTSHAQAQHDNKQWRATTTPKSR